MVDRLCPSALRHGDCRKRNRAIGLVGEMKLLLEFKLPRPPAPDDALGWIQVAQHYGLSTRLLDWTQNAAVPFSSHAAAMIQRVADADPVGLRFGASSPCGRRRPQNPQLAFSQVQRPVCALVFTTPLGMAISGDSLSGDVAQAGEWRSGRIDGSLGLPDRGDTSGAASCRRYRRSPGDRTAANDEQSPLLADFLLIVAARPRSAAGST